MTFEFEIKVKAETALRQIKAVDRELAKLPKKADSSLTSFASINKAVLSIARNASKVSNALNAIDINAKKVRNSVSSINTAFKTIEASVSKTGNALNGLTKNINNSSKSASSLKNNLNSVKINRNSIDNFTSAIRTATGKSDQLSRQISKIKLSDTGVKQFTLGITQAGKSANTLKKSLELGSGIKSAINETRILTAALNKSPMGLQAGILKAKSQLAALKAPALSSRVKVTQERAPTRERTSSASNNNRGRNLRQGGLQQELAQTAGAGGLAFEVFNAVKVYQSLEQKIRITVSSLEEQKTVLKEIFDIAERTKQPVNTVGTLYTRIAQNAKSAGRTNKEIFTLIENLSALGRISGSTAKELEASFFQFSQGLGSVLRGEELNSIIEQAPIIVDALARQLERDFAAKGQARKFDRTEVRIFAEKERGISNEVIFKALGTEKVKSEIQEITKNLNLRVEESLTLLRNSFIKSFGEIGSQSGIFNGLANAIEKISQNLEPIVKVGIIIAGVYGVRLAGALTRNIFLANGLRSAMLPIAGTALLLAENIKLSGDSGATAFDLIENVGTKAFKNILEKVNDLGNAILGLDDTDLDFSKMFETLAIGIAGIGDSIAGGITNGIVGGIESSKGIYEVVAGTITGDEDRIKQAEKRAVVTRQVLEENTKPGVKGGFLEGLAKSKKEVEDEAGKTKEADNLVDAFKKLGSATQKAIANEQQFFATKARIESGGNFNPNALNKNSKASGLFQILPSSRESYGLSEADTYNPVKSFDAVRKVEAKQRASAEKELGRPITNEERYLIHQQGYGGGLALLKNPNLNAAEALNTLKYYQKKPGVAQKAITQNGGNLKQTSAQFVETNAQLYRRNLTDKFPEKLDVINKIIAANPPASKGQLFASQAAPGTPRYSEGLKEQVNPFNDAVQELSESIKTGFLSGSRAEAQTTINNVNSKLGEDKLSPFQEDTIKNLTAQKEAIENQKKYNELRREQQQSFKDTTEGLSQENKLLSVSATERKVQQTILDQEEQTRNGLRELYKDDPSVSDADITAQARLNDAQKQAIRTAIEQNALIEKRIGLENAVKERNSRFEQDVSDLQAEREALTQTAGQREINNAILAIEKQTRSELRELYREDASIGEAEIERLARLNDAQKQRIANELAINASIKSQQDILAELRDPQEKLNERKKTFDELSASGKLTSGEQEKGNRENDLAQRQLNVDNGTGTFEDGFALSLDNSSQRIESFASAAGGTFGTLFSTIGDGFAQTMGDAIFSTDSLTESFKAVARDGISQLVTGLIQLGVQYVAQEALAATLGTAATAQATAQGATIAAAYAPAAAASSAATFGSSAVIGLAALSAIAVAAGTLFAGSFKDGGLIRGAGSGTSDSMIARVSNGEYVMNAGATNRNRSALEYMNNGGEIKNLLKPAGQGNMNNVNITVNTPDASSFNKSKGQIAKETAMAINRANRRR